MASNWKKLLKEASSKWQDAVEEAQDVSGFGSDVPDGRYYGILNSAEIVESNTSGRMQVAWEVVIAEGDYEGDTVRDYDGLETETNLKWLARKLSFLGVNVADMDLAEDLEDVLDELTEKKPKLKIRLRTKRDSDYQNMYFDQVVEEVTNYGKASKSKPKTSAAAPPAEPLKRGRKPAPEPDPEPEPAPKRGRKPAPAPEPEPEPDDDGEVIEIKVGMKCEFVQNGRVVEGEVRKILNDGEVIQVKTTAGKVVNVPNDDDFVIIEEDETD